MNEITELYFYFIIYFRIIIYLIFYFIIYPYSKTLKFNLLNFFKNLK